MMNKDFQKNILYPSLHLIKNDTKLKRFYFFPGLISVVFLSVLLVYQTIYTYVELLGNSDKFLEVILSIFHTSYALEIIVGGVAFFLIHALSTPIFEACLIRYIEQKSSGEASRGDALGFGIFRFAPLLEFNNLTGMFKIMSIVNGFLFVLRFLGLEYIGILSIIFGIAFFFSLFLNIFIAYAKFEIVLTKKNVFEAIASSTQIAMLNIKTTLRLYVMMFILNIRVILNFVVFLSFPILSAIILGFITSQVVTTITLILLGAIFIFLLVVLAYMAAVLEIFTTAIWFYAYREGKKKLTQLDKN